MDTPALASLPTGSDLPDRIGARRARSRTTQPQGGQVTDCLCGHHGCKLLAWRCLDCRASGAVPPADIIFATLACSSRRHAVVIVHDSEVSTIALKRLDEVMVSAPIVELPPPQSEAAATADGAWFLDRR